MQIWNARTIRRPELPINGNCRVKMLLVHRLSTGGRCIVARNSEGPDSVLKTVSGVTLRSGVRIPRPPL